MAGTASELNWEKRIVRFLRPLVWYLLPLGVAIGTLVVAVRLAFPTAVETAYSSKKISDYDELAGDDALVCAQPDWSFGSVVQDNTNKSVENEFIVHNRSNQTITISQITTDCGCAIADSSVRSVPPLGETVVRVKVNVQGMPGPFLKHATVFYGDDGLRKLELTMRGIVIGSMSLTTMPKIIDFGTVNLTTKSEQRARTFIICRYDMSPLELKSAEANVKGLMCEFVPPPGGQMGESIESCSVKVVLDPKVFCLNKTPGQVAWARVTVTTNREGKGCVVPIKVTVE